MARHIFFPSDFGETSQAAFPVALTLAQSFQSDLVIFHGRHPKQSEPHSSVLKPFAKLAEELGIGFQVQMTDGNDIADLALKEFTEFPPIMTVMGTHGRTPLAKWMLGSITERILRFANIPVLLVTPHSALRKWEGIKKILVGVDFSLQSHYALEWANLIAAKCSAEIHVMHIIESGVLEGTPFEFPSLKNLVPNAEATVNDAFGNFEANIHIVDSPIHHVSHGIAHRELVKVADENQIDLIVIGPHGSGGMKDLLIGSTADRVVRTSKCPVLVAKTKPDVA